jgi:predicted transcriptional regulator
MSENVSRIYVKVGEIEFSIEGNPEYVNEQYQQMAKDLNLQQKLQGSVQQQEKSKAEKSAPESTIEDFSEWVKNLPKGLKNRDKVLLAAYFNQLRSMNNVFRVRDVNKILKNQGIKITNPSSMINNLAKSQKILQQVSREGRQKYFQITKEGERHIKALLGSGNN